MTKNTIPRCGVISTSQPASPKYCIFGAGAVGGTIAAQLARANATVSIVARGETLAAIQKDGLRLLMNGETLQTTVRASADPAELGPQGLRHYRRQGGLFARGCIAHRTAARP